MDEYIVYFNFYVLVTSFSVNLWSEMIIKNCVNNTISNNDSLSINTIFHKDCVVYYYTSFENTCKLEHLKNIQNKMGLKNASVLSYPKKFFREI